jgi:hypothetical protein
VAPSRAILVLRIETSMHAGEFESSRAMLSFLEVERIRIVGSPKRLSLEYKLPLRKDRSMLQNLVITYLQPKRRTINSFLCLVSTSSRSNSGQNHRECLKDEYTTTANVLAVDVCVVLRSTTSVPQ